MIRRILSQSVSNDVRCPLFSRHLRKMLVALSAMVLIILWMMIAGGFSASAELHTTSISPTQTDQWLEPGARIEKVIAGGETHSYRVTLARGQYLRVAVEQQSVEVTTSLLLAADEKSDEKLPDTKLPDTKLPDTKLIEVDSAGTERVSAIAKESADYRVVIQARRGAPAGRYLVRIEEQRQATPRDQDRIAAERAVAEGIQLTRQGRRESLLQAIEKYQSALTLWRSLDGRQDAERQEEARTLYLLGLRHQDLGEPQAALNYCLQALALSRETGDRFRESITLNSIGGFYYSLGDKSKAINYYEQALILSRAIGDRSTEIASLVNLGVAYKALGEMQQAIDYYDQSLSAARESGNVRVEAAALSNLARLYDLQGETQRALEANAQALRLWRELGNVDGEAVTLKNLGALHERGGNRPEALRFYNQALALSQSLGDLSREAHIRGDLARVYRDLGRDQGDLIEAKAQIERTLFIFESLRDKLVAPDLRSSFFAAQRRYYEFHVGLLMRLHQADSSAGHDAAALQASEQARARALVEMLNEARADIRQGVDISLIERERALQNSIGAKESERIKLVKSKAPAAAISEFEKALLSLTAEYEQVQTQIRQTSPRYAALTDPQTLKLAEIQRQILDSETLLLEYSLGEERSFLWVVTTDSLHSFTLPPSGEIEKSVQQLYEVMAARGRKLRFEVEEKRQARIARADQEYAAIATSLSRVLLGPANDLLGKKRLLIVPDRSLHYVPFAALPAPGTEGWRDGGTEGKRGRGKATHARGPLSVPPSPLIVDHEIVNLPSATSLAILRRELVGREPAPGLVAVLADPVFDQDDNRVKAALTNTASPVIKAAEAPSNSVAKQNSANFRKELAASFQDAEDSETRTGIARLPFTRREAQAILAFSRQSESKVALDFDADRASATSASLGQFRYLHFATHGMINDKNPELSGLALSLVDRNGADQDGYLRAMDVFNLKLPAELVVLSGCRTGLGKEVRGEGMIGMTRSFLYAGAARVMVSLWNINDRATAELMERFYRELLVKGQRPAAALRAAQIAIWKEKKWREPYYWAAFVLQGEPR